MAQAQRSEPSAGSSLIGALLFIVLIVLGIILIAQQLGLLRLPWVDAVLNTPQRVQLDQPAAPALARPQVPPRVVELEAPTSAPVPVEKVTEYQVAPPAEQEAAPRVEVVTVQRAPEQTTIVRTVPQKPAGAPIVIDKGVKRMGAP